MLRARAAETGAWIVYVNAVGGQDELVFDGGSLVVAPDGSVACRAARFDEDLLVVQIDDDGFAAEQRPPWPTEPEEVYRALVLGTRDYVRKNGFREVVLGLSGGVDSALVAVIAVDALGADAVHALVDAQHVLEPGQHDRCRGCGGPPRHPARNRCRSPTSSEPTRSNSPTCDAVEGLAAENLQARIRGNDLMALSNRFGWLVLATGNKSEYAVGYSTLYGDMAGGFAPIKDVPKTLALRTVRVAQHGRARRRRSPTRS